MKTRYPIYIPSKNRATTAHTMKALDAYGVPYSIVIEPQEQDAYSHFKNVLVLPDNDRGLVFARNWIFEHAISTGAKRHWQIDDNITEFKRLYKGKRLRCDAGVALAVCEDFADRYENVALAGLNYYWFAIDALPPFFLNVHVYSCTLIDNALPFRFREPANEDVDMCLQVLSAGYCTVLLNAFLTAKLRTMTVGGGQTDAAYGGDGRLYMARSLERAWPGVVQTKRRFGRPQHVVKAQWRKFDTPLKLKKSVRLDQLPETNDYGLILTQTTEIQSPSLKKWARTNGLKSNTRNARARTKTNVRKTKRR